MSEVRILPGALRKALGLQVKTQIERSAFLGCVLFYHYPYDNGVLEGTGELFAESSHCLPLHVRRDVRVSIQREGDPRMAQDFLQDLRVLPGFEPEGSEGMPEIVRPDVWQDVGVGV